MEFDLSKPQRMLQESARTLLARECPSEKVREVMQTETAFDPQLWAAVVDQGWTGLIIPEEFGGLELGAVELAAIAEEMGRACLPGPFLSTLWAAALLSRVGNDEQRARYLEPIAAGSMRATVALLESGADWDPAAVRLRAERASGVYRLTGRKEFVSDAAVADLILCAARGEDGLVVLPVERGSAGVSIIATPAIDETRKLCTVELDGVEVPFAAAFGEGEPVLTALEEATQVATVALCAEMVGAMQWILDQSVEYVKTRQQFGKAIGGYQAVQHQCADMLLMTESARSAAYYAAWAVAGNEPVSATAVAIAKAYCSDAIREVGNRGVQVHGGIGFTWEHDLHLYYKRAKASEIMFGDATFHRERLARLVVDAAG